jgi:hypothetical protein
MSRGQDGRFARRVFWRACSLYLAACLLPCIDGTRHIDDSGLAPGGRDDSPGFVDFEDGIHFGILILLLGATGGNNGVPWSANIFWALGLYCLRTRRMRLAAVSGAIASALGLTTYVVRSDRIMVGYFFWQASLILVGVGAVLVHHKAESAAPEQKARPISEAAGDRVAA